MMKSKLWKLFSLLMICTLAFGMMGFLPATHKPPEPKPGCHFETVKHEKTIEWSTWEMKKVDGKWKLVEVKHSKVVVEEKQEEVCPAPGCFFVEQAPVKPGPHTTTATAGHKPPKPEPKYDMYCPATYDGPEPRDLVACRDCDNSNALPRAALFAKPNEAVISYTLLVKCGVSGLNKATLKSDYWQWDPTIKDFTLRGWNDLGLNECSLAMNQMVEVQANEQITVLAGMQAFPAKSSNGGPFVAVIPPGTAAIDDLKIIKGSYEGTLTWEEWNNAGLKTIQNDGMTVRKIFACGGFMYTKSDVVDGKVTWKQGSNTSQFVQFLMSDMGMSYNDALPLSLELKDKGSVTLPGM